MSNRDATNGANNYYIVQHTAYDAAGRNDFQWLGAGTLTENATLVKDNTYNPWSTQGGRLNGLSAGTYSAPYSLLQQNYLYFEALEFSNPEGMGISGGLGSFNEGGAQVPSAGLGNASGAGAETRVMHTRTQAGVTDQVFGIREACDIADSSQDG